MKDSIELKRLARKNLKGKWNSAFLISFLFSFVMILLYLLQYFYRTDEIMYLIITIGVLIVTFPLNFGFLSAMFKLRNEGNASSFECFKVAFLKFKRSWSIFGNTLRKILPIFLTFIVSTFVLSVGITTLDYNQISVHDLVSNTSFNSEIMPYIICFYAGSVGYILSLIMLIPKFFLYSLVYLIGIDEKELSSIEVVVKSSDLMKGYRFKLVKLFFSFIFEIVLTFIPFSICIELYGQPLIGLALFIICSSYLLSYMIFAFIEFYEERKSTLDNLKNTNN